jgi:type I restriction enzyme S subunit
VSQWRDMLLGDVLRLEYGKPLPDADRKPDGLYPVFGANGEKGRADKYFFDKPSIIVGRKGSAGELNLTEGKFWPLDVTYFVTFDTEAHELTFLHYLLSSLDLRRLARGVKPGINRNEVYAQRVKIPPLSEQRRIVTILQQAFESIAAGKANVEKNLQNARGVFENYLEAVYGERRDGWMEAPLGSFCEVTHGYSFEGADFSSDVPDGKPIVITPGNFTEDGRLVFNERNTKRFSGVAPNGYCFEAGDLAVVMTDLSSKMKILGKPAFVETDNILHNQRIGRVVFRSDEIERRFLYYFMMTSGFLENIKSSATGTMVKHTAPGRILSNVIAFPTDRSTQRAIVGELDRLRAQTQHLESTYQRKLAALDALKQSILHQAFTGQLGSEAA